MNVRVGHPVLEMGVIVCLRNTAQHKTGELLSMFQSHTLIQEQRVSQRHGQRTEACISKGRSALILFMDVKCRVKLEDLRALTDSHPSWSGNLHADQIHI